MIRVAYVGSRNRTDINTIQQIETTIDCIYFVTGSDGVTLISGGAKGVDTIAVTLAKKLYINTVEFIPKWHNEDGTYNKGAGFQRNWMVIDNADIIVAFWDGESKGTEHVINNAKKRGLHVFVFLPSEKIDEIELHRLIETVKDIKNNDTP